MLNGHEIVETYDLIEWAQWFETADRHVKQQNICWSRVSTVFLGIDHNWHDHGEPILFETMVFGGWWFNEWQWRYHTWNEAERGHKEVARKVFLYEWGARLLAIVGIGILVAVLTLL